MGYTHYFGFKTIRGQAKLTEEKYQRAIEDCQRIVRRYSKENGGLSGYTAHCPIGAYGGIEVNGSENSGTGEMFSLREHFAQNTTPDFTPWVKTFRRPYDLVVTACLAVLKHRLGDAMELSSDGNTDDWDAGVEFARQVTGLKLANPIVSEFRFVG